MSTLKNTIYYVDYNIIKNVQFNGTSLIINIQHTNNDTILNFYYTKMWTFEKKENNRKIHFVIHLLLYVFLLTKNKSLLMCWLSIEPMASNF